MLGERSGRRYRLGDRLQVKLVEADLETGRIDFVLSEAS
jgi:ribonuclease R